MVNHQNFAFRGRAKKRMPFFHSRSCSITDDIDNPPDELLSKVSAAETGHVMASGFIGHGSAEPCGAWRKQIVVSLIAAAEGTITRSDRFSRAHCSVTGPDDLAMVHAKHRLRT
jgi:hypothetical protein